MAASPPPLLHPSAADTPFPAAVICHLDYCNGLLSALPTSSLSLSTTCPGHPLGFLPKYAVMITSLFCFKLLTKVQPKLSAWHCSPPGDAPNRFPSPVLLTPLHGSCFSPVASTHPHLYSSGALLLLPPAPLALPQDLLCCQSPSHPSRLSSEAPSIMKLAQPCLPLSSQSTYL